MVNYSTRSIRQNLVPDELLMDEVNESTHIVVMEHILHSVGMLGLVYQHGDLSTPLADLNLSFAQLQRFSMAQALMDRFRKRGKMLLVDRTTSIVGRDARQYIQRVIREIFSEGSILTTALDPIVVSKADNNARIENGRLQMKLDN